MKTLSKLYIALILIFLYAPILVMVIFSFNSAESVWVFNGFSLDWYKELIFVDSFVRHGYHRNAKIENEKG